jgi:hypothetical protein
VEEAAGIVTVEWRNVKAVTLFENITFVKKGMMNRDGDRILFVIESVYSFLLAVLFL